MTKMQAQALERVQAVSGVMSLTVRSVDLGGDWAVRILTRWLECQTANFPNALMLIAQTIASRTP